jgi:orotidine-5'-phosphate decarboxylase
MKDFKEKMFASMRKHESNIVLNLDIMPSSLRPLPNGYTNERYMFELIDRLTPKLAAIKINSQHIFFELNKNELKKIVDNIHRYKGVAILDHKLADIGNTNLVAAHKIFSIGFDAVTIHPLIGHEDGVSVIIKEARKFNSGIISVSLMSHPGSKDFYYLKISDDEIVYKYFIKRSKEWDLDGIVIGATHTNELLEIAKFLKILKYEPIIISPGFGAQGGEFQSSHLKLNNLFPAVGRDIIYAFERNNLDIKNPVETALQRLEYYLKSAK